MDSLSSSLTPQRLLTETIQFSQGFQRDLTALQSRVSDLKRKINELAGEPGSPSKISFTAESEPIDALALSIAELKQKLTVLQACQNPPVNSLIDQALEELSSRLPLHNVVRAKGNAAFYTDFTIDTSWKTPPECRSLKPQDIDLYNLNRILSSAHAAPIQIALPANLLAKAFFRHDKDKPVHEGYMFCYRIHRHEGLVYQIHDATLGYLVRAMLGVCMIDKATEEKLLQVIDQKVDKSIVFMIVISWGQHRAFIPDLNLHEFQKRIDDWKNQGSTKSTTFNQSLIKFFVSDLGAVGSEETLVQHLRAKTQLMIFRSAFHLILGSSDMQTKSEIINSLQLKQQSFEAYELLSACVKALKPFVIKFGEHQINTQNLHCDSPLELFLFKVAIQFKDQPAKLNCLRCYIRQAAGEYSFNLPSSRIPLGSAPIYSDTQMFTLDHLFARQGQEL
jgi:hypothetical protein